jgi:integrase
VIKAFLSGPWGLEREAVMSAPARVIVTGPLTQYAERYRQELVGRGYTPWSVTAQLRLLAHLSRWMAREGLAPGDLTDRQVERFLDARRADHTQLLSHRGLARLLEYLDAEGLIPPRVTHVDAIEVSEPVREILDGFTRYLSGERGLQPRTVGYYRATAASFLSEREDRLTTKPPGTAPGATTLALTTADITQFMLAQAGAGWSLPHRASALRALLRFLHLQGFLPRPLVGAVPASARWRRRLPSRALPAGQVAQLLDGCDQHTPVGRRDRAVLLLMARLGLRAGEVAALRLEDIDWRAGEILVRGKADRWERLPLPTDVGAALADHLRQRAPGDAERHVFLRVRAPRAPLTLRGVCSVMRNACTRAGLDPAGAHRLRDTAATEIRRAGGPMGEISQLLRHRRPATTAAYTRLDSAAPADLEALRALARPWPQMAAGAR